MTDDEKRSLFEDVGITEEYIEQVERDLASGAFWGQGGWDLSLSEGSEPVTVQIEMYPAEVMAIDRRARQQGKTRSQLIRELARA